MKEQAPAYERTDIVSWFSEYSDSWHTDPYPFYDYLLKYEPLHYIEDRRFWVASRYDDVNRILKDPLFVKEYRNAIPEQFPMAEPPSHAEWTPLNNMLDNWMLNRDAPAHTRLRGFVSHGFTPRTMDRLKPKIQAIAEHLAEGMSQEPDPDLITSFAFPLPVIVIAEMLGVPSQDRELFKYWSHSFAKVLEGIDQSLEFARHMRTVTEEITDYFRRLIEEKRSAPCEDMISELVAAQGQADALTDEELIATCVLLLVAGHETTVNLIGNGVFTLLRHPDQHALLLEDPTLTASAVEEVLRFESPVQMTARFASADCEIEGKQIRRGDHVQVMLGAANRDPSKFERAEMLDITRSPNRHLAFSSGPHFCLGAPLARIEGEIAIRTLFNKFPQMRLVSENLNWRRYILFRGLSSLPVQLR